MGHLSLYEEKVSTGENTIPFDAKPFLVCTVNVLLEWLGHACGCVVGLRLYHFCLVLILLVFSQPIHSYCIAHIDHLIVHLSYVKVLVFTDEVVPALPRITISSATRIGCALVAGTQ